jgi:hypothetical protein
MSVSRRYGLIFDGRIKSSCLKRNGWEGGRQKHKKKLPISLPTILKFVAHLTSRREHPHGEKQILTERDSLYK